MSLENATKISELVATNPPGTDPVSQGDDHIRMIKNVLQLDAVSKTGPQTMEGPLTLGDYSGQLAGFRNVLINGNLRINQRNVTIAAAANGAYGPDRWKKVDASNMTQIVEEFNFKPSTTYTLSGTGVTTQQLTSPASGNWTLPNIPITATNVQLEQGSIATPFEQRPIGLELILCQRYYQEIKNDAIRVTTYAGASSAVIMSIGMLPVQMRGDPTITQPTFTYTNGSGASVGVTGGGAHIRVSWNSTALGTTGISQTTPAKLSAEL